MTRTDEELCLRYLEELVEGRRSRRGGGLVLSGFSRGARTALLLGLTTETVIDGIIAFAPAPVDDAESWDHAGEVGRTVPIVIIVGRRDAWAYADAQLLKRALEQTEHTLLWRERENLGHEYPQDFSQELKQATRFIEQGGS